MRRGLRAVRRRALAARDAVRARFWARRMRRGEVVADPLLAAGVDVRRVGAVLVDSRWAPGGVSAQFAADAETYHRRYSERLDFTALIDRCLTLAAVDRQRETRVLDIGSGGGSSVFGLCRLLPRADIVASDISPQLLEFLMAFAATRDELRGRIRAYCFDLHRRFFRPESFDLVIGAAILHHLLDPRAALANVAAALKPGGSIVLVEPLEAGSLVLTAMYARVLRVLHDVGEGDGALARLMAALRLDIQSRLGPPVEKPWTAALDDKWVFDEPYLATLGRQLGMSAVAVHPAQPRMATLYEEGFRSVLAESGNADLPIPAAVWECVREFDGGVSDALKQRLCPTGVVVLTK